MHGWPETVLSIFTDSRSVDMVVRQKLPLIYTIMDWTCCLKEHLFYNCRENMYVYNVVAISDT